MHQDHQLPTSQTAWQDDMWAGLQLSRKLKAVCFRWLWINHAADGYGWGLGGGGWRVGGARHTGAPTCCSGSSLSCIRTCFWGGHEVMMRMEGGRWEEGGHLLNPRVKPSCDCCYALLHGACAQGRLTHSHSTLVLVELFENDGQILVTDWWESTRPAVVSNPPCSSPLAWLLVCMEDAR